MGPVALPPSGSIYADANVFMYTVERVAPYFALLDDFWREVRAAQRQVPTSELTLLEVLPKPFRLADATLEQLFRDVLQLSPDVSLISVSSPIIEHAARLRATTNLKTPDAIHAATALLEGCTLFITNDPAFRRVPGRSVMVLGDLVQPIGRLPVGRRPRPSISLASSSIAGSRVERMAGRTWRAPEAPEAPEAQEAQENAAPRSVTPRRP